MGRRWIVILALALSGVPYLVATPEAAACLNAILRTKKRDRVDLPRRWSRHDPTAWKDEERVARLDQAVAHLNEGRFEQAIGSLYAMHGPFINAWALNASVSDEMQREVVYVVALATIRADGKWTRESHPQTADRDMQQANVKWAIRAIENLAFVGAVAERHIAEAWARDPGLREAAIAKLEELEKKGELKSRFQHEALARLRNEDAQAGHDT